MIIEKAHEVKEHYQEKEVVLEYLEKRFREPLNRIEHQQQVRILNQIILQRNCRNLLEFAPGPARVTAELRIENAIQGISIDASENMLALAKERMEQANKSWAFIQADILQDNLAEKIAALQAQQAVALAVAPLSPPVNSREKYADLLFCFRFLLHFQEEDRRTIYQQARALLKEEGYLVFECMNKPIVRQVRAVLGNQKYFVYDQLYTPEELRTELEQNGFTLLEAHPVLGHFKIQALLSRPFKLVGRENTAEKIISALEKIPSNNPYEWVILAQKRKSLGENVRKAREKQNELCRK